MNTVRGKECPVELLNLLGVFRPNRTAPLWWKNDPAFCRVESITFSYDKPPHESEMFTVVPK